MVSSTLCDTQVNNDAGRDHWPRVFSVDSRRRHQAGAIGSSNATAAET